jgi:hypothetical protein
LGLRQTRHPAGQVTQADGGKRRPEPDGEEAVVSC